MKVGDKIYSDQSYRTYFIEEIFEGPGGKAICAFATSEGENYFIKLLIDIRYPAEGAPGDPEKMKERRKRCQSFFEQRKRMYETIKERTSRDGMCVSIVDFFRENSFYYTVSRRIDTDHLSVKDISKLDYNVKIELLKRITQGLHTIHSANIIHGDLKPDNILINTLDACFAKVIDMDDCYPNQLPPDKVTLTEQYSSPELSEYADNEEKTDAIKKTITTKSDVFALGIIFTEYLSGEWPIFDKDRFGYVYQVVAADEKLTFSESIPEKLQILLSEMLQKEYSKRPSLYDVMSKLKDVSCLPKRREGFIKIGKVDAPLISIKDKKVIISCSTIGAVCYYTLDGSTPNNSSQKYEAPLLLDGGRRIKAVAYCKSMSRSEISIFDYQIEGKLKCKSPVTIEKTSDSDLLKSKVKTAAGTLKIK